MPTISFQPQLREFRDVLATDFYTIPRFQRPYSWTPENLEDFLQDVIRDNDEGYFIGPMVTFKAGKRVSAVVDGQQRMTTITILMCALRDQFLSIEEDQLADAVTRYIERADDDSIAHFVLRSEGAGDYLKSQIQARPPRKVVTAQNDEQRALRKAYDEITASLDDHLSGLSDQPKPGEKVSPISKELRRVRDKVLSLQTIWIQLDNEDDAYVIFETLNSRGKDLEVVDLLKNLLLSGIKAENGDLDTARIAWTNMRETLSAASNANPNKFILHWWLSKGEYTAERKLYRLLKKELPAESGKSLMLELESFASTYAKIADPGSASWLHHETRLKSSLNALELFNVRQPRPFLLATLRSYESKVIPFKTASRVVRAIESFHYISTAVVGVSSTGGVSMMYAAHARELSAAKDSAAASLVCDTLISKLRASVSARDVFISEFGRQLRHSEKQATGKKLVQYTLQQLHSAAKPHSPLDVAKCNIEHLHPQSSGDDWAAQIGNLFLISDVLNSSLGALPFAKKREVLRAVKDQYDIADILDLEKWTEVESAARAQRLAEFAYDKVWKF